MLGEALLREGKGKEAISAFDDYLLHSDPADPLRPAALEGKGYALESAQQYDEALAAFDQLAKENKTDFMKGMGLYHRARMLLLQGKTEEGAKPFVRGAVAGAQHRRRPPRPGADRAACSPRA